MEIMSICLDFFIGFSWCRRFGLARPEKRTWVLACHMIRLMYRLPGSAADLPPFTSTTSSTRSSGSAPTLRHRVDKASCLSQDFTVMTFVLDHVINRQRGWLAGITRPLIVVIVNSCQGGGGGGGGAAANYGPPDLETCVCACVCVGQHEHAHEHELLGLLYLFTFQLGFKHW